jgi:CBS-domain-containing membrane protein
MRVRDVMTPNVIAVSSNQSVLNAAQLMLENRISGLPVVDATGKLVGIVTESDFLRRDEIGTHRRRPRWLEFLIGPGRLATEYVHASGSKVEEVMTPDPYTVTEDDSLEVVVEKMERHHVKRFPVLRDGRMVGIVSRADLLRALANVSRYAPAPTAGDSTIRENILTTLAKERWAPKVKVVVRDGAVDLWGAITDERERKGVIVAIENIAGVKKVHDHLAWLDLISGTVIPSDEDQTKASS